MSSLFNYFWLLAIAVNGINAVILWQRVQPHIQQNPELEPGYRKLIQIFMGGLTIPWVIMGVGLTWGGVPTITDYFYPRQGNQFVLAWWISLWGLILLYSYWIWFRGGANFLVKYPGLVRWNPKNPRTIQFSTLLLLLVTVVNSVLFFSFHKP